MARRICAVGSGQSSDPHAFVAPPASQVHEYRNFFFGRRRNRQGPGEYAYTRTGVVEPAPSGGSAHVGRREFISPPAPPGAVANCRFETILRATSGARGHEIACLFGGPMRPNWGVGRAKNSLFTFCGWRNRPRICKRAGSREDSGGMQRGLRRQQGRHQGVRTAASVTVP